MEAKGALGKVAGVPVAGGVVDLNNADAAMLMDSVSGLVKVAVPVALGAGFLALVLNSGKSKDELRIPISSLAKITNSKRSVLGICLGDKIECECDNNELIIPMETINKISLPAFNPYHKSNWKGYKIELVDGSVLRNCKMNTDKLEFLTICGVQTIQFQKGEIVHKKTLFTRKSYSLEIFKHQDQAEIVGQTMKDVKRLREDLLFALENNQRAIIEQVGMNVFGRYFVL